MAMVVTKVCASTKAMHDTSAFRDSGDHTSPRIQSFKL